MLFIKIFRLIEFWSCETGKIENKIETPFEFIYSVEADGENVLAIGITNNNDAKYISCVCYEKERVVRIRKNYICFFIN